MHVDKTQQHPEIKVGSIKVSPHRAENIKTSGYAFEC